MTIWTLNSWVKNTQKSPSKVLDTLKKKKIDRREVDVSKLADFINENRDNVKTYEISYTDWSWKYVWWNIKLFAKGDVVWYIPKWKRVNWYVFKTYDKKDLKITAVMKNDLNLTHEEKMHQLKWKEISKFRDLKFHKNLIWNNFQKRCAALPKTIEEWENDQTWKAFEERDYKWLYDYWVTSGCALDWKIIWEKRLRTIFGDKEMEHFKEALENKEKFFSPRTQVNYKGYEYSLSCEGWEDGWPMRLFLAEEYVWCGNWHYYVWNDWNSFIYVEKD